MKKKIINNILYIILTILFVLLAFFFLKEYIDNERKQYEAYSDFSRGDIVMTLSYNKASEIYYHAIRYVQQFTNEKKISKGDLVYDFASYDFIPILNYLNKKTENERLINSFSGIMNFLLDYNSATIGLAEDVLVEQENGKYYIYKNNIYIYETKKEVISKMAFQKIYKEYLEKNNCLSVEENLVKRLFANKEINSNYTYNEIEKNIISNYSNFYKNNEEIIVSAISDDLEKFVDFYIQIIYL